MTPTDVRGQLLWVGKKVAFAALSYRRASLRVGEVVEVDTTRRDSIRVYEPTANRREWRRPDTLAIID